MKVKLNEKINDTSTMGYAASQAYHQIEEFRDQELKKINELKQPIYDQLSGLYDEIDKLKEELNKLIKQENEVLEMGFKYEALFNEYVMKDIFK